MRNLLPIKGPGGRALTTNEKVALLVLAFTLVLCVLTLLAGDGAFLEEARNPVFAVVAAICRALGGGIVGFYALVLTWSGLIYFKGEQIADVSPAPGRLLAAFGVLVGISGALGIANMQTAGALGNLVGGALGATLGGTIGIVVLLGLMLLGVNLAGQGAWFALREPAPGPAAGFASPMSPVDAADRRMSSAAPLPDDGDPSPDERYRAVMRAMEEIERSPGVTIVDVEPTQKGDETRASIGEEVDAAQEPAPETEEAEVRRGLMEVSELLERERVEEPIPHPLAPIPAQTDEAVEAVEEVEEVEEAEEDEEEDEEAKPRVYHPTYEVIEPAPREETGFAATDAALDEDEQTGADEGEQQPAGEEDADPYARGGLIKRLEQQQESGEAEPNRPYASFDWRGRPLD